MRRQPIRGETTETKPVERPTDREQAMVAAVEEFLRSTGDFAINEPVAEPPIVQEPAGRPLPQPAARDPIATQTARQDDTIEEVQAAVANGRAALSADPPRVSNQTLPVIRSVSIAPTPFHTDTSAKEIKDGTTNQALAVQEPAQEMSEARFVHFLESRSNPEDAFDFDAEWRMRLVHAALGRFTEAINVSSKMSPDSGDLLKALVSVIDAIRQTARDPMADGDEALKQVDRLRYVLADRADPRVQTIELCRKVTTFGVFEEMGEEEFLAGQAIRTIIYTEIANLSAEETPEGRFRTSLATRSEVLTASGESVWHHEESEIVDMCRRRREDFFIAQRITLPPTLPAGEYVLKLMIEDKRSGKADEASRRFAIQSPLSLASSAPN